MSAKQVKIKLIRSPIGRNPRHQATVYALGLRKMNRERVHSLTPAVAGMIKQVEYMLEVKEVN
ncbi:MAG: 50S ribosomal protein L30 [Leptospiraceae bacterium]|nr:50S ribosomal protein L30 [Leptospiraceae bacterium]